MEERQSALKFINKSTVTLKKCNASDVDVAYAAWVSNFGHEAEERDITDVSKLIDFLYKNRHMSPFEHGSFTWFIDGPMFMAREYMRHRTWSYNETSARYKEMEGRFYFPDEYRPLTQVGRPGAYVFGPGTDKQYAALSKWTKRSYRVAWMAYRCMLKVGIAKEVARNVLPVATMTQFYATANPRNVMAFLSLRNDEHAQYEIREVAKQIEKDFAEQMPLTYAAYKKYDWRTDAEELEFLRSKVDHLTSELAWGHNGKHSLGESDYAR